MFWTAFIKLVVKCHLWITICLMHYNEKQNIVPKFDTCDGFASFYGCSEMTSQDYLDLVFNKGQDVSLCEFVHRISTCFRCYPSNQSCMITTNKYTHISSLIL